MRDSFILYTRYMEQIKLLNNEQRGILLTAIYSYVMETDLPDMDGMTEMAFSFIRFQLEKDAAKYNEVCQKRREAGRAGGIAKANAILEKQNVANLANATFEKQNIANAGKKKQTVANLADSDNDNEYENDIKEKINKKENFKPPTMEEVRAYCVDRGNDIDAQSFVDFYESKGWMIGKNKMKDWKACVRTWERNGTKTRQESTAKPVKNLNNFERRRYDMDALEKQLIGGAP